jgi:hypothetical protein
MAIIKSRQEIKWPFRYYVQAGEIVVKLDGGSPRDRDGVPYLYQAADVVKARFRLFAWARHQEMILFHARRQEVPIRLTQERFLLPIEGMSVTLSADIYYRIRNPIALLANVSLDAPQSFEVNIRGRVKQLISRVYRESTLALFLHSSDTVRQLLINNPWLAESEIVLDDIAVYDLQPPQVLMDAKLAIMTKVMEFRAQAAMLRARGPAPRGRGLPSPGI